MIVLRRGSSGSPGTLEKWECGGIHKLRDGRDAGIGACRKEAEATAMRLLGMIPQLRRRAMDDVKLYQGVTIGALSVARELADEKRHPTAGKQRFCGPGERCIPDSD